MLNVSFAGVGGQGIVLASKVLAQAAQAKGWQVRTAETIGMAQRGGSVVSHVRMGDCGEEIWSPLPTRGSVDVLISMECGEAARNLALVKPDGIIVTSSNSILPTTATIENYNAGAILRELKEVHKNTVVVGSDRLENARTLNIYMLATAIKAMDGKISLEDIREAVKLCVKEQFVDMNLAVIDLVEESN